MATTALTASHGGAATRGERPGTLRRIGIFVVGGVLNVLGLLAWLLSVLLTAPLLLAGLWVWSREFVWAERLLHRVRDWAGSMWQHARAHPVRCGVTTVISLAATGTTYWWFLT